MNDDLQLAFTDILRWEGGWTQADSEPGGASNWGISMVSYGDWCAKHKLPKPTFDDLKAVTHDQAIAFYEESWTGQINFDALPVGVDLQMLNISINLGARGGITLLQEVMDLNVSGKMDGVTMLALRAYGTPDRAAGLVAQMGAAWLLNKSKTPDWYKYKAGWTNREVSITGSCLDLINASIANTAGPASNTLIANTTQGSNT